MIPLKLGPPASRRPGVISALLPSRNRAGKMARSIQSLRETAARRDLLEVLVAYDPDDPLTGAMAGQLQADLAWQAPRRYGFAGQSRYYAALAEWATGEWLLLNWSDDAQMETFGWDDLLRAQPAGSVAAFDDNYPGPDVCFVAVHADALAAVGRLEPLPSLDTWFEYAARDAGVLVRPGICVRQDRPDITGCAPDQTFAEGGGAWRAAGSGGDAFHHPPYTDWRAEDAAVLRRLRELEDGYAKRLAGPWSDAQEQMPLLRDAARRYTRPVVAELGTRTGESTSALLAGAAASGGHVWSVDCGPVTVPDWWQDTGLWSFLAADDMSDEAAKWLPEELDVLFIDTSHLYDHTLAELRKYVPRVRPGGLVLCHDTDISREFMIGYGELAAAGGPEWPVAEALGAYCAETGLSWTRQIRPADPRYPERQFSGLGCIRIPDALSRRTGEIRDH